MNCINHTEDWKAFWKQDSGAKKSWQIPIVLQQNFQSSYDLIEN